MGKIIAITNRRGRVGKTTTAINLAIAFANSGKKTLLVDLDSAGSCAKGLGFSKPETANNIFSDLKYNILIRPAILKTGVKKLDFIHIKRLPYLNQQLVGEVSTNELILKNILKPETANYDYIFIDCPPHLSGNINAALITADSVLIPVAPGKLSATAVRKIMLQLSDIRENYNPELKVAGILLTIYEFNNNDSFALKKELFNEFPKLILNTSIPKSTFVRKAFELGKPLLVFKPDDRAAKAYIKLAEELFERKNLFSLKRKS
ncbi:MAG: ParA family protein [Ignavibacteriaceae bacterium]|jgi:chromosome partitioning protein|nr:ParA family protein [Ignavibacteriaceae bacterium]